MKLLESVLVTSLWYELRQTWLCPSSCGLFHSLFSYRRILISIFLMKAGLTNHLLRQGIDSGYELEKKHFIVFNWFLFAYEHITLRQFWKFFLMLSLKSHFQCLDTVSNSSAYRTAIITCKTHIVSLPSH